ncbi:MAG: hypothetical protein AB1757_24565 [Acidobacteriota bacterium]
MNFRGSALNLRRRREALADALSVSITGTPANRYLPGKSFSLIPSFAIIFRFYS